jgi:hypothetical protein
MAKDLSTRRLGVTPCRDSCSATPSVQRSLSRRSPTTISLSWAEASSESGHQQAPDCPHQSNEQTRLVLENDCRPAFTDGPGDLVPFAPRLAPPRMKSASDSRS